MVSDSVYNVLTTGIGHIGCASSLMRPFHADTLGICCDRQNSEIVCCLNKASSQQFVKNLNVGSRVSMHRSIIGLHNSRAVMSNVSTLMDALAEFNTLERTSGFDTGCMVVERQSHDGRLTHRWTVNGRYGVPKEVARGRTVGRPSKKRRVSRNRRRTA